MSPRTTSRSLRRRVARCAVVGSLGIVGTLLAAGPSDAAPAAPSPTATPGTVVVGGVVTIDLPDIQTALDNWGWE